MQSLHVAVMMLAIPAMTFLFFVTRRFWPSVLVGETAVGYLAYSEGHLQTALPFMAGMGILVIGYEVWTTHSFRRLDRR